MILMNAKIQILLMNPALTATAGL